MPAASRSAAAWCSTPPRLSVPPHQRNIGMVFQSYAIWPHLTVFENVAFPLQIRKLAKPEIARRVGEVLGLVGLGDLGERKSSELSGGQQQRVAVARAIVQSPDAMLLDEPLSNLDAKLRDRTRAEIHRLQRALGIAAMYVTHDQAEALSLSDRVLVMNEGRVVQEGTPREIYEQPASEFVADVVGAANFLDVASEPIDAQSARVRLPGGATVDVRRGNMAGGPGADPAARSHCHCPGRRGGGLARRADQRDCAPEVVSRQSFRVRRRDRR